MTKEEIEAKARKMFPIGTKFFLAHQLHNFEEYKNYFCINTNNNFSWINEELYILLDNGYNWVDPRDQSKYGNTLLNRVVYNNGQFAKVLSIKQNNYELWEK